MVGCIFSEKYYICNIQRKAVFVAYSLAISSIVSLYLSDLYDGLAPYILYIGYFFTGVGQSLLSIILIAYATPFVRNCPTQSNLITILFGTLNIFGVIGAIIKYLLYKLSHDKLIMLLINVALLLASLIISRKLKGIPQVYYKYGESKPIIPFESFTIVFYTAGVIFT